MRRDPGADDARLVQLVGGKPGAEPVRGRGAQRAVRARGELLAVRRQRAPVDDAAAGDPEGVAALGLLWMRPEDFIVRSEPFERFRDARQAFVCTQVADAFGGYAMSQLRAVHKNRHEGYMGQKRRVLVERYGYDVKHAAHLVRLLRMAVEFLEEGTLNVYRTHDADQLRSIKRGEWELEQVQREAGELFARLEELKERSTLPA